MNKKRDQENQSLKSDELSSPAMGRGRRRSAFVMPDISHHQVLASPRPNPPRHQSIIPFSNLERSGAPSPGSEQSSLASPHHGLVFTDPAAWDCEAKGILSSPSRVGSNRQERTGARAARMESRPKPAAAKGSTRPIEGAEGAQRR